MDAYNNARCRALEIATLLCSLVEVPERPSMCPDSAQEPGRILNFSEEKQLADDFAFLACSSDDPNQVKAVCIEQEDAEDAIIVRVASNTGGLNTAPELQKLARIMMSATQPGTTRDETHNQLLSRIIHMCYERILSRLRSRHARRSRKTQNKSSLASLLRKSVAQSASSQRTVHVRVLSSCEEFFESFGQLERCERSEDIKDQLRAVLASMDPIDTGALTSLLNSNASLQPTLVEHLPEAIKKLRRYHHVATTLAKAARTTRVPHMRNISVVGIKLNSVDRNLLRGRTRGFEAVMAQVAAISYNTKSPRAQTCKRKYEQHVADSAWKVHAEIQILLHYELHNCKYPPRVICASKSACYLCHKFIQLHGKFAVPRTHGRLYDKWTLPDAALLDGDSIRDMTELLHRLTQDLTLVVRRALLSNIWHCPPNESVAMLYAHWSSHSTIPADPISVDGLTTGNSHREHGSGVEQDHVTRAPEQRSILTYALAKGDLVSMHLDKHSLFEVLVGGAHFHFEVSSEWAISEQHNPFKTITVECLDRWPQTNAGTVIDLDKMRSSIDVGVSFHGKYPSKVSCVTQRQVVVLTFG